jgi:predicted glycosyltransferase
MIPRKRFLLYSQHLSGTGHFVRTFEIARALAEVHEVYLVDGGRPIPREWTAVPLTLIALPRIYRSAGTIVTVDSQRPVTEIMDERRASLLAAVAGIRPDILLIEHFPFSKAVLYPEIIPVIEHARKVNSQVRVVCSLRDFLPRTREEPCQEQHRESVLRTLGRYFDGILVHADPAVVQFVNHVPWANEIALPIHYTGYVSEKPRNRPHAAGEPRVFDTGKQGTVIVSAGGRGSLSLISQCIAAWRRPELQSLTGHRRLIVFAPLFATPAQWHQLRHQTGGDGIEFRDFSTHFMDWLHSAELSISQAGYNTCTNILETRTRAILIPDPDMSDQGPRAQRLAALGLAATLDFNNLTVDQLARTIQALLSRPAPEHAIDLNGAPMTRQILEAL